MKKEITLKGLVVTIEAIGEHDFVSLTDLARHGTGEPKDIIKSWLRNGSTLLFLEAWEQTHNPSFKGEQMAPFYRDSADNRSAIAPQRFVEATGAIGLISKSGRGGGTWAHSDIALQFCYWLSPPFQVYLSKEFQRLKKEESVRLNLEWHVGRITNLVDEARNWLDTIPGQIPERNRLNFLNDKND